MRPQQDKWRRRAVQLLACCGFAVAAPALSAEDAPALRESRCRLEAEGLPAALALCSELVVPENPARPQGPELELFVARVPALTATPRPDPLVLIAGGPGQSTVDFYLQLRQAFEPARRERDIILLDQRGTGRSAAGFACGLGDSLALETAAPEELKAAIEDCLASLERDPRFFSTSPAVRDLDALRAALGAEQWNLYGISYGTRVAQHYARRYPERVRTMILDGVVPAGLALGPAIASDAQNALDAMFARCAADAACAERLDGLDEKFAALQRTLSEGPVSVDVSDPMTGKLETQLFDETALDAAVRLMSYSAPTVALLPLAITEAYGGNYGALAAQAQIVTGGLERSLSIPMHNSVVCTEDVPFFPDEPPDLDDTYLGSSVVDTLEAICMVWPTGVMDPDFREPLELSAPVLLLSGENDPVTPPDYAAQALEGGLENAVHLIGPGQGHGMAGVGCTPRLIGRFLETASAASVDGSCLDKQPPTPFFLSRSGPAP